MVIVMRPGATPEQIAHVVDRVTETGAEAFVSSGVTRTIVGLVGDVGVLTGSTCEPCRVWPTLARAAGATILRG